MPPQTVLMPNAIAPELSVSAEWDFLLQCCRWRFGGQSDPPRASGVDASKLEMLAQRQSVAPLLYSLLQTDDPWTEQVSTELRHRARRYVLERTGRNLQYTAELCAVTRLFAAAGVEIIPYKGIVLGELGYGNLNERGFSDLDFMIHRRDLPTIERLLLNRGYEPEVILPRWLRPLYFYQNCEFNYALYRDGIRIFHLEPHWVTGVGRYQVNLRMEDLLPFTERGVLHHTPMHLPTGEGLLLTTLLHHASRDPLSTLRQICDVAAILQRYADRIDWEPFLARLDRLRVLHLLLVALELTREILRLPLPDPVERALGAASFGPVVSDLRAHLLAETAYHHPETAARRSLRFHLRTRRHWHTKLKVVLYHGLRSVSPIGKARWYVRPKRRATASPTP